MDFDEYDYLEKQVEKSESPKMKTASAAAPNGTREREGDDESKDRRKSSKRRGGEDETEREPSRGSKRSRSEGSRDHARHRSSSVRGANDGENDANRSRNHHREERNGKESDRDQFKDPERTRDRDKERKREHKNRSQPDRHRENERKRSKEREFREKEKDPRERDTRRHREKKEEGAEPEVDPERDQRAVFAYQISLKADERDVYEFFSRAGKVRDVRLIMDRNSRRSKGVGYIEFYDAMSVPMAIALSGQLLLGQPVMVKPSEAEKNLVQSTTAFAGAGGVTGPYSGGARRLYVGNLHYNIKEEQLRQVFEPFGMVELVQLPLDPDTGNCKGYGFVQFAKLEDARAAQSLNGQLDIAGKIIKVSPVSDQVGIQDVGINSGDLDDDEGGGLALNARSRALLMKKLDRSGTTTSVATALTVPTVNPPATDGIQESILGVPPVSVPLLPTPTSLVGLAASGLPVLPTPIVQAADPIGFPSECLLLKNMFNPKLETEPDFELDIKEDVEEECSKFGAVKHIFVDKISAGHVYLRFNDTAASMNAQRALHGRWFAGKMITATFLPLLQYEAKFPRK